MIDRVIKSEQTGIVHERQARRSVDRRAIELDGYIWGIATAGKTGDFNIWTGLTARRFGEDARNDFEQIGG